MRKALVILLLLALPARAQELTVEQARQNASQASNVLREYRARLAEQSFKIDEAEAAGMPNLSGTATTNYLTPALTVQPFPGAPPIQISQNHNYNVGVTLRQAIYTFGRLEWAVEAAELQTRAAEQELRREENRLAEEVSLSFYEVLRAQERVEIAQSNLQSREAHLQDARLLLENGVVANFDVLRDEAALAQAEQAMLEAEAAQQVGRARLFSLMGLPADDRKLAPPAPQPPPDNLQQAQARAQNQRPELQALEWSVQAARARVELAAAEDNPNLSFESTYLTRNATGFSAGEQWTTGLTLSIPLFDGGLSDARADQRAEVVKQLEANRDEALRLIRLEVENLYTELTSRYRKIEVARRGLAQAEEAVRVARLRYREGLSVNVELLEAEAALTAARSDFSNARFEYLAAQARWQRALGGAP